MARAYWVKERVREFASLRGRRVRSWTGVEMAVRQDTEDRGPLFEDPQLPCLQLWSLDVERNDRQWHGIYRWRALAELPIGHVDHVSVFLDDRVVAEVLLRIGRQPLLLVAGEVYETFGEELRIHRLDESVLAFTDPDAATSITWVPARPTTLSR